MIMEHKRLEGGGYLLFLAIITLGFALIIWPFLLPMLWATLAAIMFQPLYRRILGRMKWP